MRIKCVLEFNETGTVAEIWHKGLLLARLGVRGPFKRTAENVRDGYDATFNGIVYGVADWEHISDEGAVVQDK